MTPQQARQIDPELSTMSDEELEEALRLLDGLAEVALVDYFTRHHAEHLIEKLEDQVSHTV